MKYEIREISQVKRELDVEVPGSRYQEALARATRDLSRRIKLPGFRPGKVPSEVVTRLFGKEIETDVLEKLIPEIYEEALETSKVAPLGRPILQAKDLPDTDRPNLTFTVSFEVMPKVDVKGYKGLALTKKSTTVGDAAVETSLAELRENAARFTAVEGRSVSAGDYVVVDMSQEHGARQKNVLVAVKEGEEAKELDRALVGKSVGDEFQVRIKHTHKESHEVHEGEHEHDRVFDVRVREIKERSLPDLNDDFAREVGAYEDLAALKGKLKSDLLRQAEERSRRDLVHKALDLILKENEVVAPEHLVSKEVKRLMDELAGTFKRQGLPVDKLALDWDRMAADLRPDAQKSVLLELVFDAIADGEKLEVPADRVMERIQALATNMRKSPDAVRAQLERDGKLGELETSMRRERSIDFVLDNATVTAEE